MNKYNNTMQLVTYFLVMLCAFLLPWNFIVPPCAILIVLSWLITFDYKTKWQNIRAQPLYWLFACFTILYIAGYFWSANKSEAATSIGVKVSVFIFPLIFASLKYNYKQTKIVLQCLLTGLITVGSFMLVRAFFTEPHDGVNVWTYQELCRGIMHPSYLSLYYVTGIMICFHGILLRDVPMKKKMIAVAFVLFFCVMIFMLASKTGLISLLIVFLFYICYAVIRFKRYFVAGAAVIALVIGFFIALSVFPGLKERITNLTGMMNTQGPIDPASTESNRVRILIWQQDLQLVSENPLMGVGTGDVQDELMARYQSAGMTGAYEKKLNAHSQFFQTGIALGLPGMVTLFGIFLGAFTIAVRRRFGFAALLSCLILFNFVPESMLQMQAGTFLMGFFFAFILFAADTAVLSPKQ